MPEFVTLSQTLYHHECFRFSFFFCLACARPTCVPTPAGNLHHISLESPSILILGWHFINNKHFDSTTPASSQQPLPLSPPLGLVCCFDRYATVTLHMHASNGAIGGRRTSASSLYDID